jgi:hypothetical protein
LRWGRTWSAFGFGGLIIKFALWKACPRRKFFKISGIPRTHLGIHPPVARSAQIQGLRSFRTHKAHGRRFRKVGV